ncbi:hypothetical protein N008_20090 [Hymenobacter sp. APR13]|nr:hypothetical protein N008_20090 [Hymenobacter sp. APR13]
MFRLPDAQPISDAASGLLMVAVNLLLTGFRELAVRLEMVLDGRCTS